MSKHEVEKERKSTEGSVTEKHALPRLKTVHLLAEAL